MSDIKLDTKVDDKYVENIPVLIVGGGSVGLAAALFLARLGVRSILVERHATTSNHPKARGINYRSMEIFRTVGLEESMRVAGAALANLKLSLLVETLAGKEIRRFGGFEDAASLARLSEFTPVKWCFCAQDELEPLLVAAGRKEGADIRFGVELLSFEQDETGVTANVIELGTGKPRTIRAAYLLATDGAQSLVRQQLKIGQSGRGTIGHYIGIYFKADLQELVKGREFAMCFVKNPAAPGTLSTVNNQDRWVFNVEYEPEKGTTTSDFTTARCLELVRTMVGRPELEIELLSVQPWEAAVKIADKYSVGRIFLAGDAVHVMPPAGAFGLNTGIQDVHNLAWKFAAVLNEGVNSNFLKTYEAERRPVGAFTVEQAALRLDFRGGGKPVKPDPESKQPKLIDDLTMILGYRYPVAGETAADTSAQAFLPFADELKLEGQPGTRAPLVWWKQNTQNVASLDLFDKHLVLLTSAEGQPWREAAKKVTDKLNIALDIYNIGQGGDLFDPSDKWLNAFGISLTGAVLVRPDGFIAWKSQSEGEPAEGILEEVFEHLFQTKLVQ